MVERAVLLSNGPIIGTEHLPMEKIARPSPVVASAGARGLEPVHVAGVTPRQVEAGRVDVPGLPRVARGAAGQAERERIVAALNACAGNQSRAAKLLGIPRRTFLNKLDAYGIPRPKKDLDTGDA